MRNKDERAERMRTVRLKTYERRGKRGKMVNNYTQKENKGEERTLEKPARAKRTKKTIANGAQTVQMKSLPGKKQEETI